MTVSSGHGPTEGSIRLLRQRVAIAQHRSSCSTRHSVQLTVWHAFKFPELSGDAAGSLASPSRSWQGCCPGLGPRIALASQQEFQFSVKLECSSRPSHSHGHGDCVGPGPPSAKSKCNYFDLSFIILFGKNLIQYFPLFLNCIIHHPLKSFRVIIYHYFEIYDVLI